VTEPELLIRRVDRTFEDVIDNLLELYCHDMAEWFLFDANEKGLYTYAPEKVWNDDVDVYLASIDRIPIGFALVGSGKPYTDDPGAKDLDEFFVVRRHRRRGIGQTFAANVWDRYPARWVVRVFQGNRPAVPFWRTAVAAYTSGAGREDVRTVNTRTWSYFIFDSRSRNMS